MGLSLSLLSLFLSLQSLQAMAREKMAMSYPTPASSRDGNQVDPLDPVGGNGVANCATEDGEEGEVAPETAEAKAENDNNEEVDSEENQTELELRVHNIIKEVRITLIVLCTVCMSS